MHTCSIHRLYRTYSLLKELPNFVHKSWGIFALQIGKNLIQIHLTFTQISTIFYHYPYQKMGLIKVLNHDSLLLE